MTARAPLRLAVAGAGRVFERIYAPALRHTPSIRLAAVAEPNEAQLAAVPGEDVARYRRLAEMLAAGGFDCLALLTPPQFHSEHVLMALPLGLPLLVEKPVAMNLGELQAWGEAGPPSLITPVLPRRYWRSYRSWRARAAAARQLRCVLEANPGAWGAKSGPPPGPEHDLLPHLVDLCRWATGEDVVAVEGLAGPGSATARLQLADGRSVECCARHGEGWAEGLEIDGRRHFVNEPSRWEQLERGLRRLARLPGEDVGGLADMLERWASRVRGEPADGLAGPADAWASVAIIDAYLASVAEGGKPVEVRPPPPGWSN
jgi:predicted dehydrogenase